MSSRVDQEESCLQSCGMYISSRVHPEESCFKVAKCQYHYAFIWRKDVLKLRNVYVITRKVILQLRNVYIITRSLEEKLLKSCRIYLSSHVYIITCSSRGKLS